VRQNEGPIRGLCPDCQMEVGMLSLDAAVTALGRGAFEIVTLIRRGSVHAVETETGHLLVCALSLGHY
jgi:hypothetical protein